MKIDTETLTAGLILCKIPEHIHEGLIAWIQRAQPPGHFLQAVINNDLRGACNRADEDNQSKIWNIVFFLTNYAPNGCWGYANAVEHWKIYLRGDH